MLYLEDYLEMIEHLPQELRDRFTEMREMDLNVQNNMDSLDRRSKHFFSECKRGDLKDQDADNEFQNLRKDYYKVLEEADEKVALSTQMHELVERYLRRLDNELFKFKCELEADNNGITEILEKRSLELDGGSSMSHLGTQKENRYFGSIGNNHHQSGSSSMSLQQKEHRYRHRAEKRRDSGSNAVVLEKRSNIASQPSTPSTPNYPTSAPSTPSIVRTASAASTNANANHAQPPNVAQNINAPVFNSNIAIAAAASQAIVATQQMQQGRRTASLKASYEATMGGAVNGPHEIIIGRELAGATHNAIQAVERDHQRKKKKIPSIASNQHPSTSAAAIQQPAPIQTANLAIPQVVTNPHIEVVNTRIENGLVIEQTADGEEWSYDPNEPRYCICNQVSFGDMVACDNDTCPLEWFHYSCVGISQPPKGKWYCPKCTQSMKRRNRKN